MIIMNPWLLVANKAAACVGVMPAQGNYSLGFYMPIMVGENYAHIKQKNAETPLTERKRRKDELFFPVASFSPAQ